MYLTKFSLVPTDRRIQIEGRIDYILAPVINKYCAEAYGVKFNISGNQAAGTNLT